MKSAYSALKSWMGKYDPDGPKAYVTTGDMTYAGTCGYLRSNFKDEMKSIDVTYIDSYRHIIYGNKI